MLILFLFTGAGVEAQNGPGEPPLYAPQDELSIEEYTRWVDALSPQEREVEIFRQRAVLNYLENLQHQEQYRSRSGAQYGNSYDKGAYQAPRSTGRHGQPYGANSSPYGIRGATMTPYDGGSHRQLRMQLPRLDQGMNFENGMRGQSSSELSTDFDREMERLLQRKMREFERELLKMAEDAFDIR